MAVNTRYVSRKQKLAHLKTVANDAVRRVAANTAAWRGFLRFYAGFYKYSFSEALLIYEQAPPAPPPAAS